MNEQRRWLPVVMKARQAVEDRAAQRLAAAHIEHEEAVSHAAAEDQRIEGLVSAESSTAQAFLATAAAHRAAAATHAAAQMRINFAEDQLRASAETLRDAARDRRSAQKLTEREAAEQHRIALHSSQRELDDLTVTRWGRDEPA